MRKLALLIVISVASTVTVARPNPAKIFEKYGHQL